MPIAAAVGVASAVASTPLGSRCAMKTVFRAGLIAAQYALETELWIQGKAASKVAPNGNAPHLVTSFLAGALANAVATLAVACVPGSGSAIPMGMRGAKALALGCASAGMGYATVDKTFQVLYMSKKAQPMQRSMTKSASCGDFRTVTIVALPEFAEETQQIASIPEIARLRSRKTRKSFTSSNSKMLTASAASAPCKRVATRAASSLSGKKPILALTN
eukprot:CAMPEP_0196570882 /NCGR_PEP_ID=MMETSP1081-20130531/1045_1 /TAXON_ID=36882 /ORGANISM="Pyramimonas amylifera, Strain CCMP720" /LENGTH=218 /DNA_ID=CAMNT_0041887565 /DNA_START=317 /DNA_END=973 /DNA_ORIENTATION=+